MRKNVFIDQVAYDSDMRSVQKSERILTGDAKILISIRTSDGMPYMNAINVAKQLPKLK